MPTNSMTIVALLGVLLYALTATVQEVSVSCMMAYDEGGASAVFQSPECPQWVLPHRIPKNQTSNCQFATVQGHRDYQEDRVACNLDFKIPVLGKDGPKEIVVGVFAIFDGHGGKEASEMASKYLLDHFLLHVIFCTYKQSILYESKGKLVSQDKNNTENDILTLEWYGVIAIPEVKDWESLKSKDRYLVVASDGIFESLTSQDVCELLEETAASENISPSSLWSSLAGQVVYAALRKGSMDNLSAIVVPLAQSRKSHDSI